jgi:predicted nuclease of predicted toxin-antitoxin system
MKLLANENFPLASVRYLSEKGWDIAAIGLDNMSISDREVMEIAIRENRTILTFDKDYGELIFKYFYKPEQGVIFFRLLQYAPDQPGIIADSLLSNPGFEITRKFTVVSADSIRQRGY